MKVWLLVLMLLEVRVPLEWIQLWRINTHRPMPLVEMELGIGLLGTGPGVVQKQAPQEVKVVEKPADNSATMLAIEDMGKVRTEALAAKTAKRIKLSSTTDPSDSTEAPQLTADQMGFGSPTTTA